MLATMKPDYSKMYFEFQFKDGEKARYRMDKDCHDLQQFLDRMNHFHDLEKENKRLHKKLAIAIEALEEIPDLLGNNDDYGALCCVTDALQEIEGVK